MDVVFLAFANSSENPLPALEYEADQVFSVLVNRQLKGHFAIHREPNSTLETINDYLGRYKENLILFLYSGHAGNKSLHLVGDDANAKGIAHQLGESAKEGKLKIVILNGCSTGGQVERLLEVGVPVVVATSAPINDKSATEFSISFFKGLSEKRLSIREAFEEALGPAQTSTKTDLKIDQMSRGGFEFPESNSSEPLWGLFSKSQDALNENPFPSEKVALEESDYVPNEQLTDRLFKTLLNHENRDIRNLNEKEEDGEYVEIGDKQTAIVNVLPFPIACHLQKLLCPVDLENEGFDKISLSRLEQTGTCYHMSIEFLTFVMISQLWELKLEDPNFSFKGDMANRLSQFFNLSAEERQGYDHFQLIKTLGDFLEPRVKDQKAGYFIEEFANLADILEESNSFSSACSYLRNLYIQTCTNKITEENIAGLCEEAEEALCHFFDQLGFIHRYDLASIQNIDIQKYRHQKEPVFSHETVKMMRAFGKPEHNYYQLNRNLDNRGVVLLKGKAEVLDREKRQFSGDALHFINLSPFVIDRNAFENNTDLYNLMYFDYFKKVENSYVCRSVKRPDNSKDLLEVTAEGAFEGVHQQLEAFKNMIIDENADQ